MEQTETTSLNAIDVHLYANHWRKLLVWPFKNDLWKIAPGFPSCKGKKNNENDITFCHFATLAALAAFTCYHNAVSLLMKIFGISVNGLDIRKVSFKIKWQGNNCMRGTFSVVLHWFREFQKSNNQLCKMWLKCSNSGYWDYLDFWSEHSVIF